MSNGCFKIGFIQTFVDGELGTEVAEKIVRHLSVCDKCTLLVDEVQSENEAAFSALDYDLNPLVPTERLREKVFSSIREIESKDAGWWTGLTAGLGLNTLLSRPGAAAFASVLLMICVTSAALYFGLPPSGSSVETVSVDEGAPATAIDLGNREADTRTGPAQTAEQAREIPEDSVVFEPGLTSARSTAEAQKTLKASLRIRRPIPNSANRVLPTDSTIENTDSGVAPGPELEAEGGYLRTIAALNRTVNDNKDFVLRPRERVVFERDLAVVNDAIMKMKGEVENDPENSGAREILRASYKNKIDLLNSVAERSETVASFD